MMMVIMTVLMMAQYFSYYDNDDNDNGNGHNYNKKYIIEIVVIK